MSECVIVAVPTVLGVKQTLGSFRGTPEEACGILEASLNARIKAKDHAQPLFFIHDDGSPFRRVGNTLFFALTLSKRIERHWFFSIAGVSLNSVPADSIVNFYGNVPEDDALAKYASQILIGAAKEILCISDPPPKATFHRRCIERSDGAVESFRIGSSCVHARRVADCTA